MIRKDDARKPCVMAKFFFSVGDFHEAVFFHAFIQINWQERESSLSVDFEEEIYTSLNIDEKTLCVCQKLLLCRKFRIEESHKEEKVYQGLEMGNWR